jgi:uncharacterized protein
MRVDRDLPITMDDDPVLRCDVHRPTADGKHPASLTFGPHATWLHTLE